VTRGRRRHRRSGHLAGAACCAARHHLRCWAAPGWRARAARVMRCRWMNMAGTGTFSSHLRRCGSSQQRRCRRAHCFADVQRTEVRPPPHSQPLRCCWRMKQFCGWAALPVHLRRRRGVGTCSARIGRESAAWCAHLPPPPLPRTAPYSCPPPRWATGPSIWAASPWDAPSHLAPLIRARAGCDVPRPLSSLATDS